MTNINSEIGNRIRTIRLEKRLSIEDAASRCDIHATYLNQVELGRRNLSIKTLFSIASGLNVAYESLLQDIKPIPITDKFTEELHFITQKCTNQKKQLILDLAKVISKK
jgi:transcriptional regulator with XRE-family HTH domain